MPMQKGKKRKRPRRRGLGLNGDEPARPVVNSAPKASSRPAARRRWEAPLWVNLVVGTFLVAIGIVFFLVPARGSSTNTRLLFLLLYFALAGLYFGKAIRQWRSRT